MNGNIFPLPFSSHVVFCIISVLFFVSQYIRLRYKYQLIMAVAIPSTMLIYASDNKIFFYSIGILEVLLLIAAGISIAKERKQLEKNNKLTDDSSENPQSN